MHSAATSAPVSPTTPATSSINRITAGMVFLSGVAGLIYEVVWTRLFSDIVGSAAVAMTVVFSVFLAALALGALGMGRIRVFGSRALRWYIALELGIALVGLMTSLCLISGRFWMAGHLPRADGGWLSLVLMLAPAILLIGPPALLMGGTLPVILNAARGWAMPRDVATRIYGWNTLGGALGALSTGLFLIWVVGIRGTLLTALLLNVAAAGIAAVIHARLRRTPVAGGTLGIEDVTVAGRQGAVSRAAWVWGGLAFWSGFTVLGYEILWGRMAKFLLGDRTMAISSLLFVFITCLGLGSLVTRWVARRWTDGSPRGVLRLTAALLLAAAALHFLLVPVALQTVAGGGLGSIIPVTTDLRARLAAIILLIAPPTLALGIVFPLLIWSAARLDEQPGRVVGLLYFVNMAGATSGAVLTTYALCRWVGTMSSFLVLTVLSVALAIGLLFFSVRLLRWKLALIPLVVAGLLAGAAHFPRSLVIVRDDERLLASGEDEYGVQVLVSTPEGHLRVRNNRLHLVYDFGHPQTAYAQQMPAHLAALLAADCSRVINIGTGYGITAGTFTLYPGVQSLETVEIIPFLARRQDAFAAGNFGYRADPRTRIIEGDGRFHLLQAREPYDIISVNVLDPYLPGSSALFTVDFWREARQRLKPGGVYTQLLWGSDVPRLLKGLQTVFPRILLFPCYGGTSLNVICFRDPPLDTMLDLHYERLTREAQQQMEALMGRPILEGVPELLRQSLVTAQTLAPHVAAEKGRLHTDDFPILEFRWAHGVSGVPVFDSPLVSQ